MPYFYEIVDGMERTSYINQIAHSMYPGIENKRTEAMSSAMWDELFNLFNPVYPDEYFLKHYDFSAPNHALTIDSDNDIYKVAASYPMYNCTTIKGCRVHLRTTKKADSIILNGVVFPP